MKASATTHVPAFPFARRDPFGLAPELAELRRDQPISRVEIWDGSHPWLITSLELARAVLGSRRFSSDAALPGFPTVSPERQNANALGRTLIRMDPPEHTRYRRLLNPDFVITRVNGMRAEIQRIADDLLEAMTRQSPPTDLVEAYALPLPSLVICHLLGVPRADRPYFEEWARRLVSFRSSREELRTAFDELRSYMDRLVAAKRTEPAEDVLTRLVEQERAGEMTHEEVVDNARLLLLAGHVTTANMIALGALSLLRDPDQLAALRGDPALVPGAVEELLRHMTLIQSGLRRVATEDVEIGGQLIRAGEGVIVHIAAANRDQAFTEPERFDVRHEVRHHLAFGYGFHQCLGQLLARAELQIALDTIIRRLPGLALAVPVEQLAWRDETFLHGLYELPVTW
ncbi:MAG TPA: cytochrome P450 [Candidatus Dormibacteraeota bacterium]|nr:cytochrome P450 [Candidatus Dormibacteraeota bacterium]